MISPHDDTCGEERQILWRAPPFSRCSAPRMELRCSQTVRQRVLLFVLLLAFLASGAGAQVMRRPAFAGLTLDEGVRLLQARGLTIVYSNALVRPSMRIEREPLSDDPRRILEEILAPHGLRVRKGPRGQLIVVPAPRAKSPTATGSGPLPVFLEEVVVTPGHFKLLSENPGHGHFLTRDEVDQLPHLADDPYHAVKRLPGTSGSELSAEFNVRGGDTDEVLVTIDGVELYEPFHLKDFLKIFSIVDSAAIGELNLLTGGFPVEYGGRMSGVVDISTRVPEVAMTGANVGLIQSGVLSSGRSIDGRSQWLVTARGWYPGVVHDVLAIDSGDSLTRLAVDYYDLFAKTNRTLGDTASLGVGVLAAYDDIAYRAEDSEEIEGVDAQYESTQAWVRIENAWSSRLASSSLVALGELQRERTGRASGMERGSLSIDDHRRFRFVSLKQDWTLDFFDRHLLKWGFDVKAERGAYDYVRVQPERSVAVELDRSGESYAGYAADRFRIGHALVAEVGLRWDKQFWTDDLQIAPRINLRCSAGRRSSLRVSWGRYHQWEQMNELQVADGVSHFHPAQRAEHWLLSLDHLLGNGVSLRADAYRKEVQRPRVRFENLFSGLELFPEAEWDRVLVQPDGGSAQGIELVAKSAWSGKVTWWAGYAVAKAVDDINGEEVPRSWDQRHTMTFSVNRRLGGWNFNLAGTYHSGRPTTDVVVTEHGSIAPLERNAARLPAYHRLDGRVSRSFSTRAGEVTVVGEVLNLTGRANVCCVDDFVIDQGKAVPAYRYWPRLIPSLSFRWQR